MEILIVVILMGVIAAVVGRGVAGGSQAAKINLAKADMNGSVKQYLMVKASNFKPTQMENLIKAANDNAPRDPWGGKYAFASVGGNDSRKVEISCSHVTDFSVEVDVEDWLLQP